MNKKKHSKSPFSKYLALTGVSFQMGATIYLFIYIGKKLDSSYSEGRKTFTLIFTLLGLGVSLWNLLRQLNNINKEEK